MAARKTPDKTPTVKAKQPPVLLAQTQKIVLQLEKVLAQPVITYWNSTSGSICANDVVGLYGVLKSVGRVDKLCLFIKSGGGSGEASLRMVNLLRRFTRELTVLAPLECTSAATMLALGADQILMGPLAQLSAVDTSLSHDLSPLDRDNDRVRVSQDELQRVVRLWQDQSSNGARNPYEALFGHVHPLVIGAVDRSSALSIRLCLEILSYHMKDMEKAKRISETLNGAYPSHSYPILLREAQQLGLNADELDERTNALLLELNEIYSEMGQNAMTDFDDRRSHDNSILNILEGRAGQIFFQNDKDWHYRAEERRWVTLNNRSSWRKAELVEGKPSVSIFHIR
ncbi:MAG: SDH family Clp fold serine proteinase [Parvularculaceae bacterium]